MARLSGETRVITAGRMSTSVDETNRIVDQVVGDHPECIVDAFGKADDIEPKFRRSAVGAGNTQVTRADGVHGRIYVDENHCRDWSWSTRFQKTRSDRQFRIRCNGKVVLPKWFTRHQIHLNHHRDNQTGYHLETQR